jgi:protein-tyrosine phosphatase
MEGSYGLRVWVHRHSTRLYGPRRDVSWLTWIGEERIAVGGVPTADSVARLAGLGVTHVVNCRSTAETRFSQDLAVERAMFGAACVAHAPMRDLGRRQHPRLWAPAACFAVRVLDSQPQARVLIHCQQGMHRSAMLAYAVLRLRGHTAADAAALILDHRTEAQLLPAYVSSVEQWMSSSSRPTTP